MGRASETDYVPAAINRPTTSTEPAGTATSVAIVAQTLTARTPSQVNSQTTNQFRERETQAAWESLTETVKGTHASYCSNCGKKVEKPIKFKGYFFCSQKCRESFTTPRGRVRGGKNRRHWRGGKAKRAAG